jgi:hypothetical protein
MTQCSDEAQKRLSSLSLSTVKGNDMLVELQKQITELQSDVEMTSISQKAQDQLQTLL